MHLSLIIKIVSPTKLSKGNFVVTKEVRYVDAKRPLNRTEKPFKLEDIWRIRTRLEIERNIQELALLNLAIDCKLRSCDLLKMKIRDISSGGVIHTRVLYRQSKTGRDVQFEITSRTAQSLSHWINQRLLTPSDYLFPSPRKSGYPMSYSYYAKTKNIRAVQLLLGHVKLDNTIRYLGVEIEDALNISEDTDS